MAGYLTTLEALFIAGADLQLSAVSMVMRDGTIIRRKKLTRDSAPTFIAGLIVS